MNRSMTVALVFAAALTSVGSLSAEDRSASLRGSPASMIEQNRVAKEHQLPFYRTNGEILAAVQAGELVELEGNADYEVAPFVSHPYLQPAAKLFVERLAADYRESCGQKLVVTSAVRPTSGQPRNAHALSVHPAGMAVDLRVSDRASCRSWLESEMMDMERQGLLNGIREFRPPHYHVAIYPGPYMAWAEARMAEEEAAAAEALALAEAHAAAALAAAAALRLAGGFDANGSATRSRVPLLAAIAVLMALPVGRRVYRRRRTD